MDVQLRLAKREDLSEMLDLFVSTVKYSCGNDYTEDQRRVWAASADNIQKWLCKIDTQFFIVASLNKQIVGFACLKNGNHVDLMYVHKDYQGKGIGRLLLQRLEAEGAHLNSRELTSEVSISAKSFFEANGFKVVGQQTIIIDYVKMVNFRMKKNLTKV